MPPQKPPARRFLFSTPSSNPAQNPTRKQIQKPHPPPPLPTASVTHAAPRHSTPAKRFVVAPAQRAQHPTRADEVGVGGTPRSTPKQKVTPRPRLGRVESIQDGGAGGSEGESGGDGDEEGIDYEAGGRGEEGEEEEEEMLFSLDERVKRRRILPPDGTHFTTPTPTIGMTPLRFAHAAPFYSPVTPAPALDLDTTATTTTTTPSHRPRFLPASTSPPKQLKPLPELFSPSRKANRFLPAGLAATAQSWIVDMASAGGRGGVRWSRDKDEGVRLKVRIEGLGGRERVECVGGGVVFMRGCVEVGDGAEVSVMLAGMGGARGVTNVVIETGCLVGIRAPMWNVDVGGETWTVGVDWAVLS